MTPIAEIDDYPSLVRACRARFAAMGVAIGGDSVAEVAGLPSAYIAKLLRPNSDRIIGMTSLGPLLGVMGVRLVMIEDPEATKAMLARLEPAKMLMARRRTFTFSVSLPHLQRIGRAGGIAKQAALGKQAHAAHSALGGRATAAKMTDAQKKARATKAARARHMKRARTLSEGQGRIGLDCREG